MTMATMAEPVWVSVLPVRSPQLSSHRPRPKIPLLRFANRGYDSMMLVAANTTLFDIGAIRYELLKLLGICVDVLTRRALPERFRAKVLAEAVPV